VDALVTCSATPPAASSSTVSRATTSWIQLLDSGGSSGCSSYRDLGEDSPEELRTTSCCNPKPRFCSPPSIKSGFSKKLDVFEERDELFNVGHLILAPWMPLEEDLLYEGEVVEVSFEGEFEDKTPIYSVEFLDGEVTKVASDKLSRCSVRAFFNAFEEYRELLIQKEGHGAATAWLEERKVKSLITDCDYPPEFKRFALGEPVVVQYQNSAYYYAEVITTVDPFHHTIEFINGVVKRNVHVDLIEKCSKTNYVFAFKDFLEDYEKLNGATEAALVKLAREERRLYHA
jgi:hypothetical protein